MWGAPLSLVEVFPIVFRRQVIVQLVNRSVLSAFPLSCRISNENLAQEAYANSRSSGDLTRGAKVHDCKRPHAAIWLDRHPPGPVDEK